MRTERLLSQNELNSYSDQDIITLSKLFHHDIIEDQHGVYRWRRDTIVNYILDDCPFYVPEGDPDLCRGKNYRGRLSLNELWVDFYKKKFSIFDLMKFYMGIGYSLSGFTEVFSKKAYTFFDDAEPENYNEEKDIDGSEDLITYVIRKRKGT